MNRAIETLQSISVAKAMSTNVVIIPAYATMQEAAAKLASGKMSGAPVVDEAGHIVGVLSHADFARVDATADNFGNGDFHTNEFGLVRSNSSDSYHIDHQADDCVRKHMTTAVQTIGGEQTLLDAVRYLLGQRIHQLIVIDQLNRPIGLLSSLAILEAITGTDNLSIPNRRSLDRQGSR